SPAAALGRLAAAAGIRDAPSPATAPTADAGQRAALDAQSALLASGRLIPLAFGSGDVLVAPRVRSLRIDGLGAPSLVDAWLAALGRTIPLPDAERTAVGTFVKGAVLRKDLDAAWDISTPAAHGGLTHKQWMSGDIPVVPFPAEAFQRATTKVIYSRERGSLV